MIQSRWIAIGALLAAGGFGRLPVLLAQTNLETNAGVQFNFSTPGAGNLALGGAFIALAFDASAAYTNPAGLTVIGAPETLIEARHWRFTHVFTDRGRIEGEPISQVPPDDHQGLQDGREQNDVTGLSFLSYVYPYRDWSFAVYRHELVNFEASFSTQGAFLQAIRGRNPFGIPGTVEGRLAALKNQMSVDIVAYGASAAYHIGQGISLGLSLSYFDFTIDSAAQRFLPEIATAEFGRLVNSQTQQGEDQDWGFTAGLLWESPRKRWSVGGVYRQGPDFTFSARSQSEDTQVPFVVPIQKAPFHVPDIYGVGLAFRPRDAFRLAFDYDRVLYSQLTDGFVDIFNLAVLARDFPQTEAPRDPELNRFVIDDADELHLGMEYGFLNRWPVLFVRMGAWYDPDHSLRFEGDNVGFRAVFRRRGDEMHYTAGVGLALRRIQLDTAIDYSDRVSTIAVSGGFRF